MITLYQMSISHFCEKIRWALDYKGIAAKRRNLLPGFHARIARSLAPQTHLPILEHDGVVIQGSAAIVTHLDAAFPNPSLTPDDPALRDEALAWERFVDREIGPHVRRMCYDVLLHHPDVVIPFLVHEGPWYGRFLLPRIFPKLEERMRMLMDINPASAAASRGQVETALDRMDRHRKDRPFLVGDRFTRADLAAAALVAPLVGPAEYGLPWPDQYPPDVEALMSAFSGRLDWAGDLYAAHRRPTGAVAD